MTTKMSDQERADEEERLALAEPAAARPTAPVSKAAPPAAHGDEYSEFAVDAAKFDLLVERFGEAAKRGDIEAMRAELNHKDFKDQLSARAFINSKQAQAELKSAGALALVAHVKTIRAEMDMVMLSHLYAARFAALEARLAKMETVQAKGILYRGLWQEDQSYDEGDLVTFAGSGWIARGPTKGKPNEPESGFTLAIKRGRDGKSAR